MQIRPVTLEDQGEIMALYRSLMGGQGVTWDESYPNEEIFVNEDVAGGNIFCAEEGGRIIGAVSIELDEAADRFPCWNREQEPAAHLARVAVRQEAQGKGLAKEMMRYAMDVMRKRGYRGARYLVGCANLRAQAAYRALGFEKAGEADAFGQHWLCFEKVL